MADENKTDPGCCDLRYVWEPIETAPKDGTKIVLYGYPDYQEFIGYYHKIYDRWEPQWLECHGCGCCAGRYPKPTHWFPLPEKFRGE